MIKKDNQTKKIGYNPPISLKAKVIISAIIILALTLGILITTLLYRTIHFYQQNFIHRGIALLNGVCAESKIALLAEDKNTLLQLAQAIQARSEILYIIYFDPQGHIVTISVKNKNIKHIIKQKRLGILPKKLLKSPYNNNIEIIKYNIPKLGTIYEFWKPVQSKVLPELRYYAEGNNNNNLSGIVCVGISAKEINQITNQMIKNGILLTIIAILFMGIVAYIVLYKTMKPLDELVEGVKAVGKGDRTRVVSVSSRDELGVLAREFNKMVESLKNWEQQLKESEAQYRSLFDRVQHGIVILDANGKIINSNPAFFKLLGYNNVDAIIGKNISIFSTSPEEIQHMLSELEKQKSIHDWSIKLKDKNDKLHETLFSAVGRFNEYNKFIDAEAVVIDITEQKNLEKQLIQAQKMEAIGTLAGGIAHDFNNILTGILGYVSILKQKANITKDPIFLKALSIIESSSLRAANLTKQLLAFARRGKYQETIIDLNNIVREVIRLLEETLDRRIKLIHTMEKNLWKIKADEGQIYQCILNLCINAKDAMPDGGIIKLSTQNKVLTSHQHAVGNVIPPGRYVILEVTDNGCGMSPEVRAKIFDPFFTTKEQGKGTGLGLAMVYGIIRNHDGYIQVESTPGIGTTFTIYLPAINSDNLNDEEIDISIHKDHKSDKPIGVLVIDDESAILELTRDILSEYNYQVFTASTGEEGLNILNKYKNDIDIILLDIMMPGMGGKETLFKIKREYPDIPILLVTGFAADKVAQELLKKGAASILLKPYRQTQLLKAIDNILKKTSNRLKKNEG